jgi:riboflavin biosynthesis pyrimidine reductase
MTGTGYRMGSDGPTIRQRRGSDASRLESEEDRRTDHDRHHQADRAASGSYRACAECPGERAACPASQPRHDRDRRPCLCRDRGPRLYL